MSALEFVLFDLKAGADGVGTAAREAVHRALQGRQRRAEERGDVRHRAGSAQGRPARRSGGEPAEAVEVHPVSKRGKITVAAYAPKWLDGQSLEPNTRATYENSVKHIVKRIGGLAVADVQTDDIRGIVKYLEKLGRADATISHVVTVAFLMFEAAARSKVCETNPCDPVKVKIKDQREMLTATREQAKAIEDAIPRQYKLLVRALFATGCRWSEMIAIKGTDVEQRGSGYVLKIRRTVNETWKVGLYEKPYGKSPAVDAGHHDPRGPGAGADAVRGQAVLHQHARAATCAGPTSASVRGSRRSRRPGCRAFASTTPGTATRAGLRTIPACRSSPSVTGWAIQQPDHDITVRPRHRGRSVPGGPRGGSVMARIWAKLVSGAAILTVAVVSGVVSYGHIATT